MLRITRMPLMFEWGLFLYVVAVFTVSRLLPVSELVKSIVSLPIWLIVPYFFGSCLMLVLRRFRINFLSFESHGIFSFLFGIYVLIVSIFFLDLLGMSVVLANLYLAVLVVGFAYLVLRTFRNVDVDFRFFADKYRRYVPVFVFCLLVSLIPAVIYRSDSPFPFGAVETISIPFEQYQPALRFMDYGYLQHYRVYDYVSLGLTSQLLDIDPLSFIWSSVFLMSAIFSFGLYLFSYEVSRSKSVALLTALIGSFLNLNVFRDIPLLFRSNVFLFAFLPFLLYLCCKNVSKKEYRLRDVVLTLALFSVVTVLFVYLIESDFWSFFVPNNVAVPAEWHSHVWLPVVVLTTAPVLFILGYLLKSFAKENEFLADNALLLLFVPIFCLAFLNLEAIAFIFFVFAFVFLFFLTKRKKSRLLLYVCIAFVFSFVLVQNYGVKIDSINPISSVVLPSFADSANYLTFSQRFQWVFDTNMTPVLLAVLLLGIAVSIVSRRKQDILVISAFSLALFFYLFPETFAYRFFKELSIMEGVVMAVGVSQILRFVAGVRKNYHLTVILSALTVMLLLPSLIVPIYQRTFEPPSVYESYPLAHSIVSDYEYSAAQWLKDNTPQNSLLISDFVTMQIMAPLSDKLLPMGRNYRVQALTSEDLQTTWRIKNMLSNSTFDDGDVEYLMCSVSSSDERFSDRIDMPASNRSILIVLTPRTVDWIKQPGISEVWSPEEAMVDKTFLENFTKNNPVDVIYSYEEQVYVFKVK